MKRKLELSHTVRNGTEDRRRKRRPQLGVNEFATILNGDDGLEILRVLRLFGKTVRKERKQALRGGVLMANGDGMSGNKGSKNNNSSHDHDEDNMDDDIDSDSDSESESDSDTDSSTTSTNGKDKTNSASGGTKDNKGKNRDKHSEEWMEDSKGYAVPFVGTSIVRGDTGTVQRGRWPTGLVEAYTRSSPLAIELTSTDLIPPLGPVHKQLLRRKHGRTSYAIYKSYLEALASLITVAHTAETSEQEVNGTYKAGKRIPMTQSSDSRVIAKITKDRLPGVLKLLNEETGYGKGKSGSMTSVGRLAAPCLEILANLAQTSVGTAREIARFLDDSLSDGVFRILFRPPKTDRDVDDSDNTTRSGTATRTASDSSAIDGDEDGKVVDRQQSGRASQYKARGRCLRLACVLAETWDPTVLSYIATPGSRERKISPGILHMAFRFGLTDSLFGSSAMRANTDEPESFYDDYLDGVYRLMTVARTLSTTASTSELLSVRAMSDLFVGEAVANLATLAGNAPPLVSHEQVLAGTDTYRNTTIDTDESDHDDGLPFLQEIGVESRRLLFALLASDTESPFLLRINNGPNQSNNKSHGRTIRQPETRSIAFLSTCLAKALHRVVESSMSLPIQRFIKTCLTKTPPLLPTFFRLLTIPDVQSDMLGFLARLRLAQRLLDGSSVVDLSQLTQEEQKESLLPKHLTKQALAKALQSKSGMVVEAVLKTLTAVLKCCRSVLSADTTAEGMAAWIGKRLPDVGIILSVRGRFDPFTDVEKNNGTTNTSKTAMPVYCALCMCLRAYSMNFPALVRSTNIDWGGLLPDDPERFCRKGRPLVLQHATLAMIDAATRDEEVSRWYMFGIVHCPLSIDFGSTWSFRNTDTNTH